MSSLLNKMRGDKKGWYKVSDLVEGVEIAVPRTSGGSQTSNSDPRSLTSSDVLWDEIVSIKPVGREQVYDIEVEGTHNFVGNGIFAHNTYVLRANTALAVTGEVNAVNFIVPVPTLPVSGGLPSASSTLISQIPSAVLTADGTGVDLYKLATYNLSFGQVLAARMDAEEVRVTSLESRVEALESGAISSESASLISLSTTSLASAFESLGAYITKGFAQFGSLIADRFVAATNSAGTSSAGTVNVLAGNTIAQVDNAYVQSSTKVFITFNAPVTGSWYVSEKVAGSFRVVLGEAQTADVSFDYFLVQTEGQIATSTPEVGGSPNSGSLTSGTSSPPPPAPTTTESVVVVGAPVVTLIGEAAIEVGEGLTFTDPGATAVDDTDGDLTNSIVVTGAVDTATVGLYTLTYTATDAAGNASSVSRVVTVIALASPSTSEPVSETPAPEVSIEPVPEVSEPTPEPTPEPAPVTPEPAPVASI